MVAGCGAKCVKFILFVVNFLFFCIGGAALGLGVFALVDKSKLTQMLKEAVGSAGNYDTGSLLEAGAYCLVVGGAVVVVLAILGCCGACMEQKIMLGIYAFVIILIVILEVAAVVLAAIFSNRAESELKGVLKETIDKKYDGNVKTGDPFTLGVDFAQVYFQCCGIDNWSDFNQTTKWNRTLSNGNEALIPLTCCDITDRDAYYKDPTTITAKNPSCQTVLSSVTSHYDTGCYNAIIKWAKDNAYIVIGIGVGIVVMEILCIVFACCLISALRKEKSGKS